MKYRDPSTGNFKNLTVKVSDTLPIGFIGAYGGATAPTGWLICDGSAVSRTIYSALFAAIGTTYGSGDGSTTFNLPDYRGRIGVGYGTGTDGNGESVDFTPLGSKGGEYKHTLTVDEMPSHKHRADIAANSDPLGGSSVFDFSPHGVTDNPGWSSSISVWNTGGDAAHNNIQPYIVTNYIIKAFQPVAAPANVGDLFPVGKVEIFFDNEDHSNYLGFTWERIAQGRTLVGIDSTDTAFDTIGETGGAKTHTLTIDEMPSHGNHMAGTITTTNAVAGTGIISTENPVLQGGGQPHNIMNPYLVVAYWKRVS